MDTRKLRGMLRRSREEFEEREKTIAVEKGQKGRTAERLIKGGPNRKTIRRWEEKGGDLKQFRYILALARNEPSFALRLHYEMDPDFERAWISMPRWYLRLGSVRDILSYPDVDTYPTRELEEAVERADFESLEKLAAEAAAKEMITLSDRLGRFKAAAREAERLIASINDFDRETAREVRLARVANDKEMAALVMSLYPPKEKPKPKAQPHIHEKVAVGTDTICRRCGGSWREGTYYPPEPMKGRIEALPEGPFKELLMGIGGNGPPIAESPDTPQRGD
ncbi:MAG: hypothetical protein ABR527_09170 [Gemmatimonadota bacterium]